MPHLTFNQDVQEWVRPGDLSEQQQSTYGLFNDILDKGDFAYAAELADLTVKESSETFELYDTWVPQLVEFLRRRGMSSEAVESEITRIRQLPSIVGNPSLSFLDERKSFEEHAASAKTACLDGRSEDARQLLEAGRVIWLELHDRMHDWIGELIGVAVTRLGEDIGKELWDELMAPIYAAYDGYHIKNRPWAQSLLALMTANQTACRGHLSGNGRKGSFVARELDDRFELEFSPCGSGGRTYEPDNRTGTGPRLAHPFGHRVTTDYHDWAWNKTGVCIYCAHCCLLMQRVPMEKFGYPTRVVQPPIWREGETAAPCKWTVYKDPAAVPETAYQEVGLKKPAEPGMPAGNSMN